MIRRNILSDDGIAQQYVQAVSRLKDPDAYPWPGQDGLSLYDFFVFWHHRAMMLSTPPGQMSRNAAHSGPVFLPWHRYMLLRLEGYLREAVEDDGFRIPYWDWASDSTLPDPRLSPLWDNNLLGQFIATGSTWRVRFGPNPFGGGGSPRITDRALDRSLGAPGGRLSSRAEIRELVRDNAVYDLPRFGQSAAGFRNELEGWQDMGHHHNLAHVWVGGDMTISTSPNDPAFFLLHCNVDRIWAAWQKAHPSATYRPPQSASDDLRFHRLRDPMHTFFDEEITPEDMLDFSGWYDYDTYEDIL
ncbi:MAG: tyrosinase family protein [Phycisphaerales bacterium]|nr:tyrosinase family protein [Phycisphaerales bacterium]